MSKKRKREPEPAMLTLAGIYEKLADESEDQRLRAAHSLLKDFEPRSTSIDQIKVIITRLFRGLCSSRKAARLGYSIALTEYLIELNVQRGASIENGIPASSVIDILDNETTPEGNNSGQDERDHYFGRLFGAEAIIKSNIVVVQQDLLQWKRLLDLICGIANKKPWLKQECGWILYCCIESFASSKLSAPDDFALEVVEKLTAHKLIRTPEGLAIWLEVSQGFANVKLPKDIWKHRDPLSKKDITLLADVLKDAKSRTNSDEDDYKSQGKAVWSAQLHFAWDVVLARLYANGQVNGKHTQKDHKIITLSTFWEKAVEDSLFAPTSSPERKHWGLLLLGKLISEAPVVLIQDIFSKNAMTCLVNAFKGDDRYLQRTANKAMQSLQKRVDAEPTAAATLLEDLLRGTKFIDFDKITRTKTIEKLLSMGDATAQSDIVQTLHDIISMGGTEAPEVAALQCRQVILLQGRFFAQFMSRPENIELISAKLSSHAKPLKVLEDLPPLEVLKSWIGIAYAPSNFDPELSEETRGLAKSKLSTGLEQTLKAGLLGKHLLRSAIGEIRFQERRFEQTVVAFDPAIRSILDQGWQRFESLGASWDRGSVLAKLNNKSTPFEEGLLLLYCLTLFQVYNGDAEAVEILEDLLGYHDHSEQISSKTGVRNSEDQSDALIEILLSFASKPSKFLRRMINIIFEGIAPQVTSKGLESLVRILATKESVEGQQEMFDPADEDADSQDEDGDEASDVELVDSDVEVVSTSSASEKESEDGDEEDGEESEDEELAAFDAKLAAALGTRKLTDGAEGDDESSTSGASDTDMDDDQMMVLDQKLAEVFRARQQETGKKKEKKDARETIVNFKNRVLDLIEIYLKVEYLASRSLQLLLPLLLLARKTKTKQLADRACNILNEFCKRCKGVNVPACNEYLAGIELLLALHAEAGTGASNAHANAASHASILVVKSLVNSGVKIGEVVDIYGETQKQMLTDKKSSQAGISGKETKEQASCPPRRPLAFRLTKLPHQFLIRGVCYQLHDRPPSDPLCNDRIDDLRRDIILFRDLGLNTLFIFQFDASQTHDVAMKALEDAGIYVFVVLSSPTMAVNRHAPSTSYNPTFMDYLFHKLDTLAQYPNVIGIIAASEVIHDRESTLAAPIIRAVVRDLKAYSQLKASLSGQRILPVGVQAADIMTTASSQLQYFTAGEPEARVDFYCCNNYHWAYKSSMKISGWSRDVSTYAQIPLPAFLAEYGAKMEDRPREFHETVALYSEKMTGVFSGGCVYEFYDGANGYGLVERGGDVTGEFGVLKERMRDGDGDGGTERRAGKNEDENEWRGEFPALSTFWHAMPEVPATVVDWRAVEGGILQERKEWVVIGMGDLDIGAVGE